MIERGLALALLGIDEDELVRVRAGLDLIPELRASRQPAWLNAIAIDFVLGKFAEVCRTLVVNARTLRNGNAASKQEGEEHL